MNRPRVALGLEATRPTLNRAASLQVGRALAETRRNKDLSVQVVGARLLLSPTQVAALEEVNPDAFYSAEFYATALRKYAAYLGLESDQLDRVIVEPARTDTVAPSAFKRSRRLRPEASLIPVQPRKTAIAAAAVIVTVLTAWPLISSWRSAPGRPPVSAADGPANIETDRARPSTPVASPAVSRPAVAPVTIPAVSADSQAETSPFGRVRVGAPTWVFVRYADNTTSERGLTAGGEFVLRRAPTYLAVGAADGVELEIGGRMVDSAAFVTAGQLRIGSSSLARLRRDP